MDHPPFKVLIVGASMSGLGLALMLEKLNIDYLVLEAYPEVAAHVGASVALLPNGLRILDQLGVYGDFKTMALDGATVRTPELSTLLSTDGLRNILENRYGYPMMWMSRQSGLEILHRNIKHKDRILVNKRVTAILEATDKVTVQTEDGSTYEGDIIVGGDGIHSRVRKEMWRLGNEISPGLFEEDEMSRVPAYQSALFGISKPNPKFTKSEMLTTYGNGSSFSVLVGSDLRLYWFMFENFEHVLRGKEIPRGTKEEEARIVKKHLNDGIAPGLGFKELYETSERTIMTPIHVHVFSKWHFQRIITIGDAAHKFNPMTGQGANSALESGATIANVLHRELKGRKTPLSNEEIDSMFAEVQAKRWDHVKYLVDRSSVQAQFESLDTPLDELVARKILPLAGMESFLTSFDIDFLHGESLDWTDTPRRPSLALFDNELPQKPLGRRTGTVISALVSILLAGCFGLAVYTSPGSQALLDADGSEGDISSTLHALQCFLSTFLIWNIEAQRKGNSGSILQLASLFLLAAGWFGPALAVPIYFLVSVWISGAASMTGRPVDPSKWGWVALSLPLGLSIPLITGTPWINTQGLWLVSAVLVPFVISIGSIWTKRTAAVAAGGTTASSTADPSKSMPALHASPDVVYGVAALVLAALHVYNLFGTLDVDLADAALATTKEHLALFASTTIFSAFQVYKMRQYGYVGTGTAVAGIVAVFAASILVGSWTTYVGTTWWVEKTGESMDLRVQRMSGPVTSSNEKK